MTVEDNKALIRRLFDAYNAHDLDALDAICSADLRIHLMEGREAGFADMKQARAGNKATFPDLVWTIEDAVAEADRVAVRFAMIGTQGADFAGIPASGRKVTMAGQSIYRCHDGRIVEEWVTIDMPGFLKQMQAS